MDEQPDKARIRQAVEHISEGKGSLQELDEYLEFLKRSVPNFHASNFMLSLERIVLAKHKVRELVETTGDKLSRPQLVDLVRKICNNEGSDVEIDACLELLERNVPHPSVSDLIFWNNENLTADQIVDRALAYETSPREPAP